MDLSSIPTTVLQAEHAAVDAIRHARCFLLPTPLCGHMHDIGQICDHCHAMEDCELLLDGSAGWSERKEQYLLRIRAELAERGHPISPNQSEGVSAK